MLRIGELMERDPITVTPGLTLRDLVELFARHHIAGAPVLDRGRLAGVVSASDVLGFLATVRGRPDEPRHPETAGELAADNQWTAGDDPPVGFFTALWGDEVASPGPELDADGSAGRSDLERYTVADAMARQIASLPPTCEAATAARFLVDRRIHRVLVVANGALQGILTTTDLVRAVADGKLVEVDPAVATELRRKGALLKR